MAETRTHAFVCEALGIRETIPARDWLPYAVQATKVEIITPHDGRRQVYGGALRCAGCGFGVDIKPGPGTQHPEPEYLLRCPKCGWDGIGATMHPVAATPLSEGQRDA